MRRYWSAVLGGLLWAAASSAPAEVLAIRAGGVVDPAAGTISRDQVILVEKGKIKEVGGSVAIPADARVVDLSRQVVLPGLFDAHTHLCLNLNTHGSTSLDGLLKSLLAATAIETTGYRAIEGVANARDMLLSGFTTVRDVGNAGNYADTDLRRAVEEGLVPGPTIVNAGRIIAPYGGQYHNLPAERRDIAFPEYLYADTRDEMRKAVRENVTFGAKVIKIVVDDQPYLYSAEDVRILVQESAAAGRKVAAHCATDAGARNAAEGGVASVEHGYRTSDATLELMKKNGVVLVGTDFTETVAREMGMAEYHPMQVERLKRAYRIGVRVAYGTDVVVLLPGENRGTISIAGIDSFVEAGVPPREILRAMTTNAAELLGVEKERGAIRIGLAADLIATPENPLERIETLKKVTFVMKDGRIVKGP